MDTSVDAVKGLRFDAIIVVQSRGYLIGAPLALELHLPFIPLAKEGKQPGECHTVAQDLEYGSSILQFKKCHGAWSECPIGPGNRVLVVDDLLASGGTLE